MDEQGGRARKGPHQSITLMGAHALRPMRSDMTETTNDYLAEWFVRTSSPYGSTKPDHRISAPVMQAGLSMVVWILKREVVGSTPTRPTIATGALAQLGER